MYIVKLIDKRVE